MTKPSDGARCAAYPTYLFFPSSLLPFFPFSLFPFFDPSVLRRQTALRAYADLHLYPFIENPADAAE